MASPGLALALDDDALDRLADELAERTAVRLANRLPHAEADRWMKTREAAEYLGLTVSGLHKLTAARAVPFAQEGPGCRCWFRKSELDAWRQS